jgi:hypothetical protein
MSSTSKQLVPVCANVSGPDTTTSSSTTTTATACVVSSNALLFGADFASSWTSYVLALLAAHPFDTLRVRCQTSDLSVLKILKTDGPRSLYAGILTPMFSNAPLVASIFAFNEVFRSFFRWVNVDVLKNESLRHQPHFTYPELMLSGAAAGIVATTVSTPATFIKVQQQIRGKNGGFVPSAPTLAKEIYAANGFTGLYRALLLDATCSGIGRATYFTGYEVLKKQIDLIFNRTLGPDLQKLQQQYQISKSSSSASSSSINNNNNSSNNNNVAPSYTRREIARNVLAAACTASLGWICVYPLEVCKVRIQADSILPSQRKYPTFSSVWLDVYRTMGVRGFFRGFSLTMMKSWISSGLALPLYEYLRPQMRALVPRCPEDPTPSENFGKPETYIKDLFTTAEDAY